MKGIFYTMNYKVLYRKYRPNDFENIIGQDFVVKTLKNSIINNSVSHAYIFSGPRGTGKTSTAKVFAKAINCLNPHNGSPCGECESCKNNLENPDIVEMDAASNNGVDEIRQIIDNIKLTPTNCKYKVYIIDEVHMLTPSAFNALLLTLEEPPAHVVFILATTNIENVPVTILSRCQRFDFQKITVENLILNLKNICSCENIDIDEAALEEIAYLAEGGMRDALSLLDQLSKNKEKITVELLESQIKILSKKSVDDLIKIIDNNEVENFLNQMQEYKNRNIDYKSFLKKVIDCLSSRAKKVKQTGKLTRLSFADYKNLIIQLSECFTKININVNPYTVIEMILLDCFDTNNKKVELVDSKQEDFIETKNKVSNDELVSIRINNCFVNAQKNYLEESKNYLNTLTVSTSLPGKLKSILLDSNVVCASDKYMILTCLSEHTASNSNKYLSEIEDNIKQILNMDYKLIFISENKWLEVRNEYIVNIKNGRKYQYIVEKDAKDDTIIDDVFDMSKVEII